MKKMIALWLAGMLLLSSCAAADEGTASSVDLKAAADELMERGLFEETLNQVDEGIAGKLYDISDASAAYVYVGSGASADELALFEFSGSEDAEKAVEAAEARVNSQMEDFAGYIPAEVEKLDHALIKTYGRYLVVCVSDEGDAGEIISEYFEQKG